MVWRVSMVTPWSKFRMPSLYACTSARQQVIDRMTG